MACDATKTGRCILSPVGVLFGALVPTAEAEDGHFPVVGHMPIPKSKPMNNPNVSLITVRH